MNKKTREVIETLLAVLDDSCSCEPEDATQKEIDDARAHYAKKGAAIAAAEKLLNPPVRFAWTRLSGSGGTYFADVAGVSYEVSRLIVPSGRGWLASANDEVFSGSFSTLAQAKQACVDYGVARVKAKRENKA